MQPQNLAEYAILRQEIESVKNCMTTYVGFVFAGAATAEISLLVQEKAKDGYPFYATACLVAAFITVLVLRVILYKFNSTNRYAGYCKLLSQERYDIENSSSNQIHLWEPCLSLLRKSNLSPYPPASTPSATGTGILNRLLNRLKAQIHLLWEHCLSLLRKLWKPCRSLLDKLWKPASTSTPSATESVVPILDGLMVKDMGLDTAWQQKTLGLVGSRPAVDKGSQWKGLQILWNAYTYGNPMVDTWDFPVWIVGIFLCLTGIFVATELFFWWNTSTENTWWWVQGTLWLFLIVGWWVHFGKLYRLMRGSRTIDAYCSKFLPIRWYLLVKEYGVSRYRIVGYRLPQCSAEMLRLVPWS